MLPPTPLSKWIIGRREIRFWLARNFSKARSDESVNLTRNNDWFGAEEEEEEEAHGKAERRYSVFSQSVVAAIFVSDESPKSVDSSSSSSTPALTPMRAPYYFNWDKATDGMSVWSSLSIESFWRRKLATRAKSWSAFFLYRGLQGVRRGRSRKEKSARSCKGVRSRGYTVLWSSLMPI